MSKERLDEITRKFLDEGYVYDRHNPVPQRFDYDMKWVLEYANEQAERVQELERTIKTTTGISYTQFKNRIKSERKWFAHQTELVEEKHNLKQQNKCYREVMSIAMGMIQYNRTEKENKVYRLLGQVLEESE